MSLALIGAFGFGVAVAALLLARVVRDPSPRSGLAGHPDAASLREAGWRGGLGRWEAIRAVLVVASAALVLGLGLPAITALVAGLAPSAWIRMRADAARERARRALTRIVKGTEAALRSGATLPEALRREAEAATDPHARSVVLGALREFDLGASLDAGLRSAAADSPDRRTELVLGTLAVGVEDRLPRERIADLLSALVDRLSFEEQLEDEVRARASGARQQQRLLALLVPAIAVLLIATTPSLAAALDAPLGRLVLIPGAVALEASGIVLARRIVSEALA
ncbi:MAG: hypothetical protein A3H36_07150 [Chloroflexi bacterium RIFCSPLOWO2_02_FULL_71_16]|nr:MAG: hypothetical protein A3H36_07150 [Chloroflexi bacterium RIFCSPLOWO2_02_FULL_71_16]